MVFANLPGIKAYKLDNNLLPVPTSRAPRVLIVGTASKGAGDSFYVVPTTSAARSAFGNSGTLIRGMWEALKTGAQEVALYRIGSTAAELTGVGDALGVGGYTITTVEQDEDAGGNYSMYYDDSEERLVVRRNSDNLVVFDNDATNPIELYEVTVSGYRAVAGGADIGSSVSFIDLEDVDSSTYAGTAFTAGTDGLSLSRMELYEQLYVAYKNLLSEDFDVIVPMDTYLDDYNIVDQGHFLGAITPVIPAGSVYPTAGAYRLGIDVDSLGKFYVEEYEGEFYFWWAIGGTATAAIHPSVGLASATLKIDGTALTTADYHEVNFAYQQARFLYDYSTEFVDATGVIGVLPPASNSLRDRARWYGTSPTWTLANGVETIATGSDDGSGLLGNKFKVGMAAHRDGVFGGGLILTDSEFMDGDEQLDANDAPIDLGKYISVVADTVFLRNNWYSAGYLSPYSASYAGFYVGLPPASAPSNKPVTGASLVFKYTLPKYNALTGAGYVTLRTKTNGSLVVTDAPTATMPNSDWKRLSTVRIVKAIIDGCRLVLDPFIGNGTGSSKISSMRNAVENQVLLPAKKDGYLQSYKEFSVLQSPQQAVQGVVEVSLTLQPAFEIRQINITVSLSKTGS